jgi:nitroreductase
LSEYIIAMTDFFSVIQARKSARNYLPNPVEKEKLVTIAKAAYEAPSAAPLSISIVTNVALIQEINNKALAAMMASGNDFLVSQATIPGYQPLYGASAILVFSGANAPFSSAGAAASATTAAFAATALGLGSVYTITPTLAINNDLDLAKRVGLAEGNISHVGLLVGYESPPTIPPADRAKIYDIKYVE